MSWLWVFSTYERRHSVLKLLVQLIGSQQVGLLYVIVILTQFPTHEHMSMDFQYLYHSFMRQNNKMILFL